MDIDDLDIYHDLDDFHEEQKKKSNELLALEAKCNESQRAVEEAQLQNKELRKKIKVMELNFQSLLDTARAEIKRKDQMITELRKEKDDICFRRKFPKRFPAASDSPAAHQQPASPVEAVHHAPYANPIQHKQPSKGERAQAQHKEAARTGPREEEAAPPTVEPTHPKHAQDPRSTARSRDRSRDHTNVDRDPRNRSRDPHRHDGGGSNEDGRRESSRHWRESRQPQRRNSQPESSKRDRDREYARRNESLNPRAYQSSSEDSTQHSSHQRRTSSKDKDNKNYKDRGKDSDAEHKKSWKSQPADAKLAQSKTAEVDRGQGRQLRARSVEKDKLPARRIGIAEYREFKKDQLEGERQAHSQQQENKTTVLSAKDPRALPCATASGGNSQQDLAGATRPSTSDNVQNALDHKEQSATAPPAGDVEKNADDTKPSTSLNPPPDSVVAPCTSQGTDEEKAKDSQGHDLIAEWKSRAKAETCAIVSSRRSSEEFPILRVSPNISPQKRLSDSEELETPRNYCKAPAVCERKKADSNWLAKEVDPMEIDDDTDVDNTDEEKALREPVNDGNSQRCAKTEEDILRTLYSDVDLDTKALSAEQSACQTGEHLRDSVKETSPDMKTTAFDQKGKRKNLEKAEEAKQMATSAATATAFLGTTEQAAIVRSANEEDAALEVPSHKEVFTVSDHSRVEPVVRGDSDSRIDNKPDDKVEKKRQAKLAAGSTSALDQCHSDHAVTRSHTEAEEQSSAGSAIVHSSSSSHNGALGMAKTALKTPKEAEEVIDRGIEAKPGVSHALEQNIQPEQSAEFGSKGIATDGESKSDQETDRMTASGSNAKDDRICHEGVKEHAEAEEATRRTDGSEDLKENTPANEPEAIVDRKRGSTSPEKNGSVASTSSPKSVGGISERKAEHKSPADSMTSQESAVTKVQHKLSRNRNTEKVASVQDRALHNADTTGKASTDDLQGELSENGKHSERAPVATPRASNLGMGQAKCRPALKPKRIRDAGAAQEVTERNGNIQKEAQLQVQSTGDAQAMEAVKLLRKNIKLGIKEEHRGKLASVMSPPRRRVCKSAVRDKKPTTMKAALKSPRRPKVKPRPSQIEKKQNDTDKDVLSSQLKASAAAEVAECADVAAESQACGGAEGKSGGQGEERCAEVQRPACSTVRRILDTSSDDGDLESPLKWRRNHLQCKRKRVEMFSETEDDDADDKPLRKKTQVTAENVVEADVCHALFQGSTAIPEYAIATSPLNRDAKYNEIDLRMRSMFQSPPYEGSEGACAALNSSTINASATSMASTDGTQTHITIDETVNSSCALPDSCSLNDSSNASTDVKHISLGSSDYRFEKVAENVVNLFITRKRGKKRRPPAAAACAQATLSDQVIPSR